MTKITLHGGQEEARYWANIQSAFWAASKAVPDLLTDLVFHCDGGVVSAHRFVLKKVCPNIFVTSEDHQTLDVILPETNLDTVKALLELIYTGKVTLFSDLVTLNDLESLQANLGFFKSNVFCLETSRIDISSNESPNSETPAFTDEAFQFVACNEVVKDLPEETSMDIADNNKSETEEASKKCPLCCEVVSGDVAVLKHITLFHFFQEAMECFSNLSTGLTCTLCNVNQPNTEELVMHIGGDHKKVLKILDNYYLSTQDEDDVRFNQDVYDDTLAGYEEERSNTAEPRELTTEGRMDIEPWQASPNSQESDEEPKHSTGGMAYAQMANMPDKQESETESKVPPAKPNPDIPCLICGKLFPYRVYMIDHMSSHHYKEELLGQHSSKIRGAYGKCTLCSRKFSSRSKMATHIGTRHKKVYELLARDGLTLPQKRTRRTRRTKRTKRTRDAKFFECKVCGLRRKLKQEITSHAVYKHFKQQLLDSHYVNQFTAKGNMCPLCDKFCTTQSEFILHLGRRHKIPEEFKDVAVPRRLGEESGGSVEEMKSKLCSSFSEGRGRRPVEELREPRGPQEYECKACGLTRKSKNAIYKHATTNHFKQHFLASNYLKMYLARGNLCPLCDKSYSAQSEFILHLALGHRVLQELMDIAVPKSNNEATNRIVEEERSSPDRTGGEDECELEVESLPIITHVRNGIAW